MQFCIYFVIILYRNKAVINKNNNKKRKFQDTTLTQCNFIKTKKNKICKKSQRIIPISNQLMMDAITKISNKLKRDTLFGLIPTIDCYFIDSNINNNNNNNKRNKYNKTNHSKCDKYLTTKEFFDADFKSSEIVWCEPPYNVPLIKQILRIYVLRKINGYLCTRYYNPHHYKYKSQCWLFDLMSKRCTAYGMVEQNSYHGKYDYAILYFENQQKKKK